MDEIDFTNLDKWIQELRTTKARQCRNMLREGAFGANAYCAVGIGLVCAGLNLDTSRYSDFITWLCVGADGDKEIWTRFDDLLTDAITWNDRYKKSFPEIADFLEHLKTEVLA